jgi:hypothetical protein
LSKIISVSNQSLFTYSAYLIQNESKRSKTISCNTAKFADDETHISNDLE